MAVATRPVERGDEPYLLDLYCATRGEEFAALAADPGAVRALLTQQYRARGVGWAASPPTTDDRIIAVDGDAVGRLVLQRRPDGIRVVDVAVAPGHQRRGIGTAVLGQVIAEADAVGAPVTLHVLATSPARRLYERLGFRALTGDGVHELMERLPTDHALAQPKTAT